MTAESWQLKCVVAAWTCQRATKQPEPPLAKLLGSPGVPRAAPFPGFPQPLAKVPETGWGRSKGVRPFLGSWRACGVEWGYQELSTCRQSRDENSGFLGLDPVLTRRPLLRRFLQQSGGSQPGFHMLCTLE